MNPCVELCYLRYGKEYSPECNEKCDYAKAVDELKKYQAIGTVEEFKMLKERGGNDDS